MPATASSPETARCPECGTSLQPGAECRSLFDAMLALEWQVPGGAGELAHFLAVSTYVVQHPESMAYRADALLLVLAALREVLVEERSIGEVRRRIRPALDGNGRVRRADGDAIPTWPGVCWERTVRDVLDGGRANYREQVAAWARSAVRNLDVLEHQSFD